MGAGEVLKTKVVNELDAGRIGLGAVRRIVGTQEKGSPRERCW